MTKRHGYLAAKRRWLRGRRKRFSREPERMEIIAFHQGFAMGQSALNKRFSECENAENVFLGERCGWDHNHLKMMVEFNDEFFPSWRDEPLVYYSNALAGEVGEFCNCVKKLAGGGTRRNRIVSPEDARGELIDAWIYLGLAWMRMGGTSESFDAAFLAKMAEITRRMTERRGGPK